MKKLIKLLAFGLTVVLLLNTVVLAKDIRNWDSETDATLTDITDKIEWESGTYVQSGSVLNETNASDSIRTIKNFGNGQLLIKCADGYKVMFAECIDDEGALTVRRKYGSSFKLPQLTWMEFTYLNTYRDRNYVLIIKSNDGKAINPDNAQQYVTISEVDVRYHVPEYYVEHIENKADVVNQLQEKDGAFSFLYISDIHLQHNTKHSPAMVRYLKENCGIKDMLGGGDFVTAWLGDTDGIRGLWDDMEELRYLYQDIPIFKNLGNHEWAYGGQNQWNITNEQAYNRFFRDYDYYNENVVYNDTKQYFYADDTENKIRYISVNGMDYESHKIVKDYNTDNYTQNKAMWFEITDTQVQWLKDEALRLPGDDWSCLVLTHVPIISSKWGINGVASDNATDNIKNALNAYVNKTGDMADAKGNFIGMFCGHNHVDRITKVNGFNLIITDGDTTISGDKERTINTVTEQEFNVITVVPAERKVYITKIGAGNDTTFTY